MTAGEPRGTEDMKETVLVVYKHQLMMLSSCFEEIRMRGLPLEKAPRCPLNMVTTGDRTHPMGPLM